MSEAMRQSYEKDPVLEWERDEVGWLLRDTRTGEGFRSGQEEDPARRRALPEALGRAIERVNALHRDSCDLGHPGTPSATVTIARRHGGTLDHLVLADSVLVLNRPDGELVISDDRLVITSKALRKSMDALPTGSAEHCRAERFGLLTWTDLLDLLRHKGPETLLAQTRAAERDDPEGRRWPRSKTHDDATAVHWTLRT